MNHFKWSALNRRVQTEYWHFPNWIKIEIQQKTHYRETFPVNDGTWNIPVNIHNGIKFIIKLIVSK